MICRRERKPRTGKADQLLLASHNIVGAVGGRGVRPFVFLLGLSRCKRSTGNLLVTHDVHDVRIWDMYH